MQEYSSSEELQRQNAMDAFMRTEKKQAKTVDTEKARVVKLLDRYLSQHKATDGVRAMAKDNNRTNDYQLDLSADIVLILEKIKSELR